MPTPCSSTATPCTPAPAAGPLQGYVHAIESGSAVDGPGIRYVVFLAGCPLQCLYCHNPDSQKMKGGTLQTVAEVMAPITAYAPMLKRMKGGLTLSGGEPLVQPAFTAALLREAKALGLHTALDTSGYLGARADDTLLADVDVVLLDIKSGDPATYKQVTGVELPPTLAFAKRLAAMGKPMWMRFVMVPGLTDAPENIAPIAAFTATLPNIQRIEILPFHKLGEHKWQNAPRPYQLANTPAPSPEAVERVRAQFREAGNAVVV